MERSLRPVTWWRLERYIDHADEWVDEGVGYDTKEEAEADIAEYREFYPNETYRLAEYHGNLIYKR